MYRKTNIGEIAPGLRQLLKQKSSYEELIRSTTWHEGPVTIVGSGAMAPSGIAASLAFESLLGWPAAFREVAEFEAYSFSCVKPRSLLVAVSPSGEEEVLTELVRRAAKRGTTSLAVTEDAGNALARAARGTFVLPRAPAEPHSVASPLLTRAALSYIALLAAKIFNPRHPQLPELEAEFETLPERLEWLETHLRDGVRALAAELKQSTRLTIVGCGLYYPSALEAAWLSRGVVTGMVEAPYPGCVTGEFRAVPRAKEHLIVLVSGSHCRVRKNVHELAARLVKHRARLISITDTNDRSLIGLSGASLLMPPLAEFTGALLALPVLSWLILESARDG